MANLETYSLVVYSKGESAPPTDQVRMNNIIAQYAYDKQKQDFSRQYSKAIRKGQKILKRELDLRQINTSSELGQVYRDLQKGLETIQTLKAAVKFGRAKRSEISKTREYITVFQKLISAVQKLQELGRNGGITVTKKDSWQKAMYDPLLREAAPEFVSRIMNGDLSQIRALDIENLFVAFGANFSRNLGYAMEDIQKALLSTPEGQKFLTDNLESSFKKVLGVSEPVGTAQRGFRAGIQGVQINLTKEISKELSINAGFPLRDAVLQVSMNSNGSGTLSMALDQTRPIGISMKQYNYLRNRITVATVSFSRFYNQLNTVDMDNKLYFLRGYSYQSFVNSYGNGFAYYLAKENLEELYFGQKLVEDGKTIADDRTDLLIYNGKLMNLQSFLMSTQPGIDTHGAPTNGIYYIPPSEVPRYIDKVFSSKLHFYQEIGKNIIY